MLNLRSTPNDSNIHYASDIRNILLHHLAQMHNIYFHLPKEDANEKEKNCLIKLENNFF